MSCAADLYPLVTGCGVGRHHPGHPPSRWIERVAERPDLLVGGPPCVAFSKSGFWLDWKRDGVDPAASLLQAYTRVLAEARPSHFILENVYALTFNNKASQPAFERLLSEIDAAGYQFTWQVLNAADYGVPQLRPRLFIVGAAKSEKLPELPEPTHHGEWERANGQRRTAPARDCRRGARRARHRARARGGGPRASGGTCSQTSLPATTTCTSRPNAGTPSPIFEWRSRYWSFLLKLDPDRPSPTIQAQPGPNVGPFHWENRRLRVPELRRLFTFPDDFAFVGSRASVQSQIGNSVPPLLGQRVARGHRRTR